MAKDILFSDRAKAKLLSGATKAVASIAPTLGPRGESVVLERKFGVPTVVDDGITIFKELELSDPFENLACEIVRDASQRTNDLAGDGTTTSAILAGALIKEGMKIISTGVSAQMVRRGIEYAVPLVVESLKKQAKEVKTLEDRINIATLASRDEGLGKLIAETVNRVGTEGVVTVEEGDSFETEVEYRQGMEVDSGFVSPHFITRADNQSAELDNPYVLLTDYSLTSVADLLPFFKRFSQEAKTKALVVVAEKIEGSVLASMVVTKMQGMIALTGLRAPGVGERKQENLFDLASLLGATIISQESGKGLDEIEMSDLGRCKKVIQYKDSTIFQEGVGNPKLRITQIKKEMKEAKGDYRREQLQERLARLSSGIAVIRVGAPTPSEMKEKKERVVDAVNATKAAIEEGYVIGGALSMIKAQQAISKKIFPISEEQMAGVKVVRKALVYPFRKLIENAGEEWGRVLERVENKPNGYGYNAMTGKIEDLYKAGVIDPVKVVRLAFENAVSVASVLLTSSVLVCFDKRERRLAQEAQIPGRRV